MKKGFWWDFGAQKPADGLPLHVNSLYAQQKRPPSWALTLLCFTISALGLLAYKHNATNFHILISGQRDAELMKGPRNPAYLIRARHGAVASENKICSDIGVDVLKEGGNAIDAAIATTFCIGVANMFSSGIGGGGFMTVRIPSSGPENKSQVYTIDFRETAPALSNTTMYVGRPESAKFGGLAVGVPGELRGLEEAHNRWGSLPWKRLVLPSILLAQGRKVDKELERRINMHSELMLTNPDWSVIFAPNGRLLSEGDIILRANLSRTLSNIAEGGADVFYKGPIADAIIEKIRSTGGILSHEDLEHYNVIVEQALQGTYRGKLVYTTHAPTSGPAFLHMLNLMEKFTINTRNGLTTHRIVEILKFGFAARTRLCDPRFNNSTARINRISTKAYADTIFKNITDEFTHPPEYYNPEYDVKIDQGTSHTSVVDKNGMAVALTSTVNLVFGSQVLDPVTGVILNDEMDDFSTRGVPNAFGLWPSPYNYPEAGKRPLSSVIPTIVENSDGSFFLAVGGSGGSKIFGSVFQVLINLELGLDASEAVEFGRLHDQLYPLQLDADDVYPIDLLDDLRRRRHNVTIADVNRIAAVVQAVVQNGSTIYAASDSRKNGIAAGY